MAHYCKFGNHFSVAGMPFSCDDHKMAYPSYWVKETPNIGMWIVYHSSCKVWASCWWLTDAFRLLWSQRSSSRFTIFGEAAKCSVLLIVISLACDEVLGHRPVGTGLISCSLSRTVCPVILLLLGIFLDASAAWQKRFLRVQWMNITIFRRGCDTWLATSLMIAKSHRMMKTCLQSWNHIAHKQAMNITILCYSINWCSIYNDTNGKFALHLTQSRHC